MNIIAEIEAYMDRVNMPPTTFGRLAMKDGNFLQRAKGRNLRQRTIDGLLQFMSDNADWTPPAPKPKKSYRKIVRNVQSASTAGNDNGRSYSPRPLLVVRRDPCWRCGVRGDIGCAHQPAEMAVMG